MIPPERRVGYRTEQRTNYDKAHFKCERSPLRVGASLHPHPAVNDLDRRMVIIVKYLKAGL